MPRFFRGPAEGGFDDGLVLSNSRTLCTGRLVAEHLLGTYGATGDIKWAMAGRNTRKPYAPARGTPSLSV
jgi:hypothetical protein